MIRKFYKIALTLALLLCFGPNISANILEIPEGEATLVGIYIKDLKKDKVIVDHNSKLALTPASITKSITTATALTKLGTGFRFSTGIDLVGYRRNNRWNGNIVINSSGDPTIGSEQFEDLNLDFTDTIVSLLKEMNIEVISGNIIVNQGLADAGPVRNWEFDDLEYGYGAGLYGFNYHHNCDSIGVMNDPAANYVRMLQAKLDSAQIKVNQVEFDEVDDLDTIRIYEHFSPTALEISESLMKRSDNLFAEGMLRAIAPDSSRKACLKIERNFLKSIGLNVDQSIILDGSGLSRANRFSPYFIGQLLEYMSKSKIADKYLSTFPVAGVDGTLKRFLKKTKLDGRLAMKTGSMRAVQCYAGYKLDKKGKPTHVVVVMVNGFFCPRYDLQKQIENYLLKTFK